VSFGLVSLALVAYAAPAGDKKDDSVAKKPDPPLLVLDAQGKEVMVTTWHLTGGTRRLPGIDGVVPKPPPFSGGPEYIEFREEKSTTYQAGILTLVRTASMRKLDYDYDKKTVTAVVATASGKDATLVGTTRFSGHQPARHRGRRRPGQSRLSRPSSSRGAIPRAASPPCAFLRRSPRLK